MFNTHEVHTIVKGTSSALLAAGMLLGPSVVIAHASEVSPSTSSSELPSPSESDSTPIPSETSASSSPTESVSPTPSVSFTESTPTPTATEETPILVSESGFTPGTHSSTSHPTQPELPATGVNSDINHYMAVGGAALVAIGVGIVAASNVSRKSGKYS